MGFRAFAGPSLFAAMGFRASLIASSALPLVFLIGLGLSLGLRSKDRTLVYTILLYYISLLDFRCTRPFNCGVLRSIYAGRWVSCPIA